MRPGPAHWFRLAPVMPALPRRLLGVVAALMATGLVVPSAQAVESTPSPSADPSVTATAQPVRSAVGGERLALTTRQVERGPQAEPLGRIKAKSWILVDVDSGAVLAAKDPHRALPPASTLKSLTALTLLPRLPLDQQTKATGNAVRSEGTRVGLLPGKTYTVEELMYGLMLASGNDAAIALAEANGGVRETVEQMNATARSLQALDTVARNPSGLDARGQVSSAYDLALIARAGLAREDFRRFASTVTFEFPGKGKRTYPIYTQNDLLLDRYRGAIGVKTGFTTDAGRTFVAGATRKGRTLVFVGLGIKDGSAQTAAKALTWGFRNADKVTPIGQLVEPGQAAVQTLATSPEPATPVDLSSAGLLVPTADDPMAPWWFWVLLALAAAAALFVMLRRRNPRHRRPASVFESPTAIRVDYHPYDPR